MTKKRQHYVWKHYINSWGNRKNHVYVVMNDNEFLTNTENLAVEQYLALPISLQERLENVATTEQIGQIWSND